MNHLVRITTLPLAVAALIGAAIGQTPNTTRGAAGAQAPQSAQGSTSNDALTQAIEMNTAEVALAKLATTKAQNAKVKSFAEMMVKDHTDALAKLHGVQSGSNMDMKPSAPHQATADRLSKLSGAEFDREYMTTMVSDHQQALTFFQAQSGTSGTPAGGNSLAKVSQDLVPAIQKHLQEAQNIQKELGASTSRQSNTGSASANSNSNQRGGAGGNSTSPNPGAPNGTPGSNTPAGNTPAGGNR